MKIKKILGLLLTAVLLVGTLPATTFAATTPTPTPALEKAKIKKEMDAVAAKLGVEAVSLDNVDPSSVKLHFDSVEDFENSIGTLHEELNVPQSVDQLIQPMTFTGKFYGTPRPVWLGSREIIGYITQELWATEVWNSSYGTNTFSTIDYQDSYIAPYGVGFSWTPKPYINQFLDGRRTIQATADGKIVVGIAIKGYTIGLTWSMSFTDFFYAV